MHLASGMCHLNTFGRSTRWTAQQTSPQARAKHSYCLLPVAIGDLKVACTSAHRSSVGQLNTDKVLPLHHIRNLG